MTTYTRSFTEKQLEDITTAANILCRLRGEDLADEKRGTNPWGETFTYTDWSATEKEVIRHMQVLAALHEAGINPFNGHDDGK